MTPVGAAREALAEALEDDTEVLLGKFGLMDQFYARPVRSPGSLTEVANSAVTASSAASCAAVSVWHRGTLRVEATTDPVASRLEQLQRRLNHGPTLEVLVAGHAYGALLPTMTERTSHDDSREQTGAFPDLARCVHDLGLGAVLSMRVTTGLPETRAALTVATPAGRAFGEDDFLEALTIARNAQGAVGAHQVMHLTRALETSRDLGVAVGILMSRYQVTREDALRMLKRASQDRNRKANVLALQIIETGELPDS